LSLYRRPLRCFVVPFNPSFVLKMAQGQNLALTDLRVPSLLDSGVPPTPPLLCDASPCTLTAKPCTFIPKTWLKPVVAFFLSLSLSLSRSLSLSLSLALSRSRPFALCAPVPLRKQVALQTQCEHPLLAAPEGGGDQIHPEKARKSG